MDRIIGIGEYTITEDINTVVKTYALSSCVALTAYDSFRKVLGMVHIALPSADIVQNRAIANPAYYADTAVPMLINKIRLRYGCGIKELELGLFGGAQSIRKDDVFHIGVRNVEMVEAALKQMNLKVCHYDIGGTSSRSVAVEVATGKVKVICQPLFI
ncbi:MAG: chemotaxis protein CheD [Clostridiaceae bacterium]|jgi:chemotaxis protein CheD|nr:chemotaxis protein CheD [Clostridiaceae bacterium]